MTLWEEEDWGRKMTGALKWTFRAIRVLRSASSFTPDAAFSAAWTVTSARASLASWKLLMNAWEEERKQQSAGDKLIGIKVAGNAENGFYGSFHILSLNFIITL